MRSPSPRPSSSLVRDQARRDAFARVRSIRIAVGALSHVEPRALEFGFEAVSRGTVADGAKLVMERPGGEGWCTDCNATVANPGERSAVPPVRRPQVGADGGRRDARRRLGGGLMCGICGCDQPETGTVSTRGTSMTTSMRTLTTTTTILTTVRTTLTGRTLTMPRTSRAS